MDRLCTLSLESSIATGCMSVRTVVAEPDRYRAPGRGRGGEGGPAPMLTGLGEVDLMRGSLPFGGRIGSVWFGTAAVVTSVVVVLLALAPIF
jgi:hypothetical protein